MQEPQCLGVRFEVQEVAPYPPHHALLQLLPLKPSSPPLAALCAHTFLPPKKRSFHGRFQHKVVPFFHCLCLVFLSSGDLSLPSCMPMPLSSTQLKFVFTSPYHSCPFCLHCLGSSSKIFGHPLTQNRRTEVQQVPQHCPYLPQPCNCLCLTFLSFFHSAASALPFFRRKKWSVRF